MRSFAPVPAITARLPHSVRGLARRTHDRALDDRGDVPGWVLITLMTAGLVLVIWGVAGPALEGVFEQAIDRVRAI